MIVEKLTNQPFWFFNNCFHIVLVLQMPHQLTPATKTYATARERMWAIAWWCAWTFWHNDMRCTTANYCYKTSTTRFLVFVFVVPLISQSGEYLQHLKRYFARSSDCKISCIFSYQWNWIYLIIFPCWTLWWYMWSVYLAVPILSDSKMVHNDFSTDSSHIWHATVTYLSVQMKVFHQFDASSVSSTA